MIYFQLKKLNLEFKVFKLKDRYCVENAKKNYGGIAGRSSWAQKFVSVGAGIIVADCRENVYVILFNFCKQTFDITKMHIS